MFGIVVDSAASLPLAALAAVLIATPDPPAVAGLACMIANGGQGNAPVYHDPTSGVVANRSMPVVLAVLAPSGEVEARAGRVRIRTPSNHEGWVDARLLRPYPGCTPVMMRDPAGRLLLGFK